MEVCWSVRTSIMRSKFVVKLTMKGPDSNTLPLTAEICGHDMGQ
jgi:hypothetical protein